MPSLIKNKIITSIVTRSYHYPLTSVNHLLQSLVETERKKIDIVNIHPRPQLIAT